MNQNSLKNLELGRQQMYSGESEKIRTNLSLSKSARAYLCRGGCKMSEAIEFLIYCQSNGEYGTLPPGDDWQDLWERHLEQSTDQSNGVETDTEKIESSQPTHSGSKQSEAIPDPSSQPTHSGSKRNEAIFQELKEAIALEPNSDGYRPGAEEYSHQFSSDEAAIDFITSLKRDGIHYGIAWTANCGYSIIYGVRPHHAVVIKQRLDEVRAAPGSRIRENCDPSPQNRVGHKKTRKALIELNLKAGQTARSLPSASS